MALNFRQSCANSTARNMRAVRILSIASLLCLILPFSTAQEIGPSAIPATPTAPIPAPIPAATPASTPASPRFTTSVTPKNQIKIAKPLWSELTPSQQQILAPLSPDWDQLDSLRKKKWLAFAKKYPTMKPEEQQRVQERMREWAKLTPEQRRSARESYVHAKKIDPDKKSEKWQQYQNLSEEEKKKLAAEAESKKRVTNLPKATDSKNKAQTRPSPKTMVEHSSTTTTTLPMLSHPVAQPAPQ
jgi:hypothetical protein